MTDPSEISRLLDDHGAAARPRIAAAPGTSSRPSPPSRPTRSRKPTRSPRPPRPATPPRSRRTGRPAAPGRVPRPHGRGSRPLRLRRCRARPSPTRWCAAIRTSSATPRIADAAAQTVGLGGPEGRGAPRQGRASGAPPSALDGVGVGLPALTRAAKLQRRAARVGFDWPDVAPIFDKIDEEIAELRARDRRRRRPARIEDELGDLLFAVVNLARRLEIDPEQALRGACRKFERRFRAIEARARRRGNLAGAPRSTRWRRNGSARRRPKSLSYGFASRWMRLDVSQRLPPRSWTRS